MEEPPQAVEPSEGSRSEVLRKYLAIPTVRRVWHMLPTGPHILIEAWACML